MATTGLFVCEVPNIDITDGIVRLSIQNGDRVYCLPVSTVRASVEMLRRRLDEWDREQTGKLVKMPPGKH